MANVKITNYLAIDAPVGADLLEIVDDVAGTPTSKKVTVTQLFTAPALVTPNLGTPSAGVLTNCTGLPTAGLATQVFAAGIGIGGAAAQTGGIAFPATAVPSADPNTLDDYEEGTWPAGYICGTSGTITISSIYNTGKYTKTGRQVTVTGYFPVASVSLPVGTLRITGLPFTNPSGLGDLVSVTLFSDGLAAGAITHMMGFIGNGSTAISIYRYEAGGGNSTPSNLIQADSYFILSATYMI